MSLPVVHSPTDFQVFENWPHFIDFGLTWFAGLLSLLFENAGMISVGQIICKACLCTDLSSHISIIQLENKLQWS